MKRSTCVFVRRSDGRPAAGVKVWIEVFQFMAGGVETEYTDHDGKAWFHTDFDAGAEIAVWVGNDCIAKRGSIRADYSATV